MIATEMSRIEKPIFLRAPRARCWRALTDVQEFCKWFGVKIDGVFEPGARLRMVATQPGYEGMTVDFVIQQMEPERLFSWRWHPGAPDAATDYSKEPTTLVEFHLEDAEGGTLLTVRETGFDEISLARRARVYKQNNDGWAEQLESIHRYVGEPA